MDMSKLIGGVKLVSEVLSAERPDAEKLKTVVKAVALGYSKLLPRINPALKEKPLKEQFVHCGLSAYATVGLIRNSYQVCTGKISVEEASEKVIRILKVGIASVPKIVPLIANVHPVFKAASVAIAPVCEQYAPTLAEKMRPCVRSIVSTAKTTVTNFAKTVVRSGLQTVKAFLFG